MSLQRRVDDALFLWRSGRRDGAFLIALVAVAATARKRFPDRKVVSDRNAFEQFLEAALSVRLSVEYRGECVPIEHIFYKWFRCELVHEGELPMDIDFMPNDEPGSLSIRAGGAPEFILKVSEGWFHHFIGAVTTAPENRDLFQVPRSAVVSLEELARQQGVRPVERFEDLLGGWPEDEIDDGFEEAVLRWRGHTPDEA
jgi:hypothetical protein